MCLYSNSINWEIAGLVDNGSDNSSYTSPIIDITFERTLWRQYLNEAEGQEGS